MELLPWGDEYFDDLVRLSSDPRVVEYVGDGKPWPLGYATERHERALARWAEYGFGWHAAIENQKFVGLGSMAVRDEGIEIGWWVDPNHWGRGVATAIASAMRDLALEHSDRVIAGFIDGNGASGRVMVKIGMRHVRSFVGEGRLQHFYELTRV
ncbi:N-acetyltransferase [Lentzea sp. NBRC 105346]|uniref:GNAT family N-acetyltransferase n=1 Tax=Lentzea sp. NBRC 105346 TaxID=3032205 RepID=UPI0024A40A95|nr:GNAT family N-acetyltransferase [Lentzea sp. NBRC 105346]GLZ34411.1 N-acetyltransferase [Lentzea sp. NBRC 105346]